MLKSGFVILALGVFLFAQPCWGDTAVPDPFLSEAFIAYEGPGVPTVLVVPDGSGSPFSEAHDEQGQVVDATITLYLRDNQGIPFVYFPHEDMWLESADGGQVSCTWGVLADQDTDFNGMKCPAWGSRGKDKVCLIVPGA